MKYEITSKNINLSLKNTISNAIEEDKAFNDITSDAVMQKNSKVEFAIIARENSILCGVEAIKICFNKLKLNQKFYNSNLEYKILKNDGDKLLCGDKIATGTGDSNLIFSAERTILNLIQHLSGIATTTNLFVNKLNNPKITILDTRKTIAGLRFLQKFAVKIGGGDNHRLDLSSMILIKDNHLATSKNIITAVADAKKFCYQNNINSKIEVECDNINQVKEAIIAQADIIMLDNMTIEQISNASKLIRKNNSIRSILIEVSGGINLDNITQYQNLDIDFISVGALTHSAKAIDIGLDIIKFI
ncbi:MAG: carboxylating nicotinate-nucleotide diphosphorylase [Rickettsiales bacterium]|jgi:nicotinate-nucleotide pyrophosphorylase (carboxylating)|nr:carboxylating nicotinate-nucleotide diphosphorylase [Rickettsiales bacterium]